MSPDHLFDGARLTLDYEADFEMFRALFEALYREGEVFGLDAVVRACAGIKCGRHKPRFRRGLLGANAEKAQLEYQDANGGNPANSGLTERSDEILHKLRNARVLAGPRLRRTGVCADACRAAERKFGNSGDSIDWDERRRF